MSRLSLGVRVVLLCSVACWLSGCGEKQPDGAAGAASVIAGQRIVSLAPSLTETLFALGLGDDVVAVTAYCVTPEAAKALPKVGAWTDVNVERVMAFRPTCVCLPATHPMRGKFEQLGVPILPLAGRTLEDVFASIEEAGRHFGRETAAAALLQEQRRRLAALKERQQGKKIRPRALVVIGRARGTGTLRDMTVAGDDGYFHELLAAAGAEMVPSGLGISYPAMSLEGVLALNPDVIIEIAPECEERGEAGRAAVAADWTRCLPELAAVKAGRVLVFTENYATVPGLRSVLFAEKLAERLAAVMGDGQKASEGAKD